jgi:2-polyprenyl-3-methyl-5-hydroxy-6-metoxy-1,4-benzoquinol methylase
MNAKKIKRMQTKKFHNSYQRHYYETALDKPAMQVVDSHYVYNHMEQMIRSGGLSRKMKILEVGAGLGKFSIPLLKRNYQVSCNDLSETLLHKLCEHAGCHPKTIPCDIKDIQDNTEEKFHKVIGFFTLHHMTELEQVFKAIHHVLIPGGEVIFIEPVAQNPLYYMQILLTPRMAWKAEKGILNMTDSKVHSAMCQGCINPLPSETYGFFPPFIMNLPGGSRFERSLNKIKILRRAHAFKIFKGKRP